MEHRYQELICSIIEYLNKRPNLTPQVIQIKKRTGGFRTVYIPNDEHKEQLRKFLRLAKYILASRHNNSYISNSIIRSLKKSPRDICHYKPTDVESCSLVSIDLKSAFDSVNINIPLEQLKYLHNSIIDTSLLSVYRLLIVHPDLREFLTYKNRIPTGYPTSNLLYEIALYALDKKLNEIKFPVSGKYKDLFNPTVLIYRIYRYVDDIKIFISTIAEPMIGVVKQIIEEFGFIINKKKLSVKKYREGWKVFNLSIGKTIKIPKKVRNKIRGLNHRLELSKSLEEKEDLERKLIGTMSYYWPKIPGHTLLELAKHNAAKIY